MNSTKKGFTLIELLVVVLIMGILAAIALPQDQIAIEKTRMSGALSNVRVFAAAIERYRLATGNNPKSFDELDVNLPGTISMYQNLISIGKFVYHIDYTNNTFVARYLPSSNYSNWGESDALIAYWFGQDIRTTSDILSGNSLICAVKIATAKENVFTKICFALGASDAKKLSLAGYMHYKL
jgi:prepilin-type N-terminal cleavage/methylation domain-containing protein